MRRRLRIFISSPGDVAEERLRANLVVQKLARDYARFLDMMLHLGVAGTQRLLSPGSVLEIERDQVQGLDTHADAAVEITRIPTYGLGVWRDVTGPMDTSVVVSGSGALGFYPWIDRAHGNFGVVAVDDERGSDLAVPASAKVAKLAWTTAAASP